MVYDIIIPKQQKGERFWTAYIMHNTNIR